MGMKTVETWVDAKDQVVYVKGSRKNWAGRLTRQELQATKMLISGTVTKEGKVFYAPFRRVS